MKQKMKQKMKQSMKQKVERGIALFLALVLAFTGMSSELVSAATASAKTMKLNTYQGKVTVQNAKGSSKKTTKGMRLLKGDKVATAAKSNAYIELDSTKAVKMDANTKVQLFQSGKDLELVAQSGNLFFNVKKPLGAKESLRVRSSTLIAGVRGTSAFLTVEKNKTSIFLLEGTLKVSKLASNKKETAVGTITGGKVVTLEKKSGKDVVTTKKFTEKDVPYYVLEEIAKDKDLQKKIDKLSTLSSKTLLTIKTYVEQGMTQEDAIKKATFKGTPKLSKINISWDLKKNATTRVKTLYKSYDYAGDEAWKNWKYVNISVEIRNFKELKASKGRKKVSFEIVMRWLRDEVEGSYTGVVKDENERSDYLSGVIGHLLVDYQTGEYMHDKYGVTGKVENLNKGGEYGHLKMVIEYPESYKDLCLIVAGTTRPITLEEMEREVPFLEQDFSYSQTDSAFCHGMRIP